jgi:CHASE1-domain containing sensor protein
MSSGEVRDKARQTAKSVGELLDAVKKAAHARLAKEAPKVANALDGSFDRASKTLTDTLNTIDKSTAKEQAELLKAYKSFLDKQAEIIEKRMASMKGKEPKAESG